MTVDLSGGEEGAAFGPPLPTASDTTGSLPPDVASALDRMQARDDAVFVATSMADLAARHGAALRQAEMAGSGMADGFTAQVGDSLSRDVNGIVSRAAAQPGPRPSDSALDLSRQVAQLHVEHRRLEVVEPGVETPSHDFAAHVAPVIP